MDGAAVPVTLRPVSRQAAEAVLAGEPPPGVTVAADFPTEFSQGVASSALSGRPGLGPFFLHRDEDDVVVGEIGGGFVGPGELMIGYAVVKSVEGRGYATEAVRQLLGHARADPGIERVVAHTPLDRPASARVLEKAGFTGTGETEDEDDGVPIRVLRWELAVGS